MRLMWISSGRIFVWEKRRLLPTLLLLLLLSAGAAFLLGMRFSEERMRQEQQADYARMVSGWQQSLDAHFRQLQDMRVETESNIEALTMRLGELQARSLRLDTLGTHLAKLSGVGEDLRFDPMQTPGLGGVEEMPTESFPATGFAELFRSLDELQSRLTDRSQKMHALEALWIEKSLMQESTVMELPVADHAWISSRFGFRIDPFTGRREHHAGVDFSGRPGSRIVSVADGIVTWSGWRPNYGNMIEISHGKVRARYAHNEKNLVKAGEKISRGQVIATMGNTGRSTGTHLHFEVLKDGRKVDPAKYVDFSLIHARLDKEP